MRNAFTFDDVSLVPQYSALRSRKDVDLSTRVGNQMLSIPILSSPMDTVTGTDMQIAMSNIGGMGIHHRYCDIETTIKASSLGGIAVSPSMGFDFLERVTKNTLLVIDVAHGDSKPALDYAEGLVTRGYYVMSGNICTGIAARRYMDVGVTVFRVGIGSGGNCSTRMVAGVGVPQLTAIMDVHEACPKCHVISDGGHRTAGDIVKALAGGADAVILGRMLAGSEESPGERRQCGEIAVDDVTGLGYYKTNHKMQKALRGMASAEALDEAGKERNVEGVATWVNVDGPVKGIVKEICNGLRAGFAYLGSYNINQLQERAEFVLVTQNGYREGTPHVL